MFWVMDANSGREGGKKFAGPEQDFLWPGSTAHECDTGAIVGARNAKPIKRLFISVWNRKVFPKKSQLQIGSRAESITAQSVTVRPEINSSSFP